MKNITIVLMVLAVIAALVITGCTQQPQVLLTPVPTLIAPASQPTALQPAETIRITASPLGTILADARGMTLYSFAKDLPGSGASACSGACAGIWPIFSADTVTVSPPLQASDFSTINRTDGKKQTTYRGWPLYYYQADTKVGNVSGENVNKLWFVVKADETVKISQQGSFGLFLSDRAGKTLYYFTKDRAGVSTCTGACLEKWPPFSADPVSAPSVLKPADFSAVSRADGVKQTAFMGRPLYYFADDAKPGDARGDSVNAVWYVANVSGITPPVTIVPTTLKTLSSSSSSY